MHRTAAAATPAASSNTWTVFAIVAVGVFMATLDSSIVNINLPEVAAVVDARAAGGYPNSFSDYLDDRPYTHVATADTTVSIPAA